ncbi:hypothetical protein VTK73DRAFT_10015 [Phialemonium thermophilum]|uniref:PRKR-interacting protein 1 n=1 Tax=Phialemonium thermophilum TaxID=223376 RepID=A0ABR3Y494_9PEZI
MSGEGPESIPTSADPRSKRPVKKRAVSPIAVQAKELEALFARPDQEIRVPPPGSSRQRPRLPPPPEIVTNVQGSSAGAGSGEFHVYKASRRREYERLRQMDEEMRREKEAEEFERARREREARDAEKTRKNREKREKKLKARKEKAKGEGREHNKAFSALPQPQQHLSDDTAQEDKDGEVVPPGSIDQSLSNGSIAVDTDTPGLLIHEDD